MKITINHKPFEIDGEKCNLLIALEIAGIQPYGIAVAVNGTVVPASELSETSVKNGDNIIVIKAFYGG